MLSCLLQKEFQLHAAGGEAPVTPRRGPQEQTPAGSSSDNSSNNPGTGSSSSLALDRFREELKAVMLGTGLSGGKEAMLLVNESHISDETILADIDAVANTGEVGFRDWS